MSSLSRLRLRTLVVALAVTVAATLAVTTGHARSLPASAAAAPAAADDDEVGALIGDLVFHADLMSALDRLCARSNGDWHAPLASLLEQAFTPELRLLSRRLGGDAATQMVAQRGGCRSRGFEAAYGESRDEYRTLLQRWRAMAPGQ